MDFSDFIVDANFSNKDQEQDKAFAFAFDLEFIPQKSVHQVQIEVLEQKLNDANQIIKALNGMNAELRDECGKKSKMIHEIKQSKQQVIMEGMMLHKEHLMKHKTQEDEIACLTHQMEVMTHQMEDMTHQMEDMTHQMEDERRSNVTLEANLTRAEDYSASLETVIECYQTQLKECEEKCKTLKVGSTRVRIEESVCKKQERHDAVYHAYFKLPPRWIPHWEEDLTEMIRDFHNPIAKDMFQKDVCNNILEQFQTMVYDSIWDLEDIPIFLYYNYISYNRADINATHGIIANCYVITRHSIYYLQNAENGTLVVGNPNDSVTLEYGRPTTINLPADVFEMNVRPKTQELPSSYKCKLIHYKKLNYLAIRHIECFINKNKGCIGHVDIGIRVQRMRGQEDMNRKLVSMIKTRDTLIDMCCV